MKIEVGKSYLSNGKPIRILCTDRNNEYYPVIGLHEDGSIMYFAEDGSYAYSDEWNLVEVWEPTMNEWCWFWDNIDKPVSAHVSMYLGRDGELFRSSDFLTWDNCAKFIGELPSHLKGIR
jgi:hypothetical protein